MHFKLLITLAEDSKTHAIMAAAREAGATGATILSQARGEGLKQTKTFFGLTLEAQRDMLLFLVEEHLSRDILERTLKSVNSTPSRARASPSRSTWRMRWGFRSRSAD